VSGFPRPVNGYVQNLEGILFTSIGIHDLEKLHARVNRPQAIRLCGSLTKFVYLWTCNSARLADLTMKLGNREGHKPQAASREECY